MSRKTKKHEGWSYVELQRKNKQLQQELSIESRTLLKARGYRNVGWANIIQLSAEIQRLLEVETLAKTDLEDLFLEADQIGNKYQEPEEIQAFHAKMSVAAAAVEEIVDRIFPDTEPEFINFGAVNRPQRRRSSNQIKTYRTIQV